MRLRYTITPARVLHHPRTAGKHRHLFGPVHFHASGLRRYPRTVLPEIVCNVSDISGRIPAKTSVPDPTEIRPAPESTINISSVRRNINPIEPIFSRFASAKGDKSKTNV